MTKWLERWTCNSEALSSSRSVTASWICSRWSRDPFLAALVNNQLVCLQLVRGFYPVMFDASYLFQIIARLHQQ